MQSPITTNALTREKLLADINMLESQGLHKEADIVREQYKEILSPSVPKETERWLAQFITCYSKMLAMKEQVIKLAKVNDTVLICGETGTGKELIARALHGARPVERFVDVNCAAMPADLMESELFGHEQGAFTGAHKDTVGLFQYAQDGTLFLDEIGELDFRVQAKLLRVLQEGEIRKVGGKKNIKVNCRVVAATHRNLREYVTSSKFRGDLYHRLSIFELTINNLLTRNADIPLIVKHCNDVYIARAAERKEHVAYPIKDIDGFVKQIEIAKLSGNVRSLQKLVRNYHLFGKI